MPEDFGSDLFTRNSSVQGPPQTSRNYTKLVDTTEKPVTHSRNMVGMTYKYSQKMSDKNRQLSKVFPSYGIAPSNVQSAKRSAEISERTLYNEVKNHDKLFFRQKYFMKDFMEELIRSNVNPNKRK